MREKWEETENKEKDRRETGKKRGKGWRVWEEGKEGRRTAEEGKGGENQDGDTRYHPPWPQVPFNFILCLILP